jgi:spiro-SPASM protein
MNQIAAVLSLLHQSPGRPSSASRLFRNEPVLAWTLRRLARSRGLAHRAILCWDDQLLAVQPIANAAGAFILSKGPRQPIPGIEAITASRKWSDGWRGGLLGACSFDLGFHAMWVNEIRKHLSDDAVVMIDPDSALVDPTLIDGLIAHARQHNEIEYCFTPAAPGLSGVMLSASLLEKLAAAGGYLGRGLNYWPDLPGRDPISAEQCAPVPTSVARTTRRFNLDSDRQVRLIEQSTVSLNGELMETDAEQIVARLAAGPAVDALPRDIVLEINTTRAARPIYSPSRHLDIHRADLAVEQARQLFSELVACDDIRLTLGGVGDPMLSPHVFDIVDAARHAGVDSIHIETDLIGLDESKIQRLAEAPVDIVSVHIPALSQPLYQQMMGVDALGEVVESIRRLFAHRESRTRGVPIVVPTFVKCRENQHEMEVWYDQWLRAVGCAVIAGPTDYAGQIPDPAAADMAPPRRVSCRRLASRMTILSDGRVVSCEQDVLGLQALGRIGEQSLHDIWTGGFAKLRADHACGQWNNHSLCGQCREWHRP